MIRLQLDYTRNQVCLYKSWGKLIRLQHKEIEGESNKKMKHPLKSNY